MAQAGPHNTSGILHNLRLVTLFILILSSILTLFALSVGTAAYFLSRSNQSLTDITQEIDTRMGLSNSSNHFRTARLLLIEAAVAGRQGNTDLLTQSLKQAQGRISQSQSSLDLYLQRPVKTPFDINLDPVLKEAYNNYLNQGIRPMLAAAANGQFDDVIALEANKTRLLDDAYNKPLLEAVAFRTQRAKGLNDIAQANSTHGYALMGAGFVAALVLVLLTFLLIGRVLIAPIHRLVARVQGISKGDLTQPAEPHGRNEIGFLSDNVQQMQDSLVNMVTDVRQGADAIYHGSAEIATGNTDLSSRTEEQAAALGETAASMEQLTATVKQNSENAHHARQLATAASDKARQGGTIVADVIKTMDNISGSSKKIAEITSVINSIAFQTNILALNAAVEAARAGETGRGFAVVASEVRNLAQRSAQAAKEVAALIDESGEFVKEGAALVDLAGHTMQEIVSSVINVTDIMGEIASASDEQSHGIGQVSVAITQMDNVTQQNAALVQQATATAASLEEQASLLIDVVSIFQLSKALAQGGVEAVLAPTPASLSVASGPAKAAGPDSWESF